MKITAATSSHALPVSPSRTLPAPSPLLPTILISILAILPALAISAFAQGSPNPPYMKEFPSVDQVMSNVKGNRASDTTIRQIAAFRQFKQIIQVLAGSRYYQHQLTPDETRIYGAYDVQYNKLAQPLNFPDDSDYYGRRDFIDSLCATFHMPTVQQLWTAAMTKPVAKNPPPQPSSSEPVGTNPYSPIPQGNRPLPATNDAGQLAMRRCVELGGAMLDCISKGMSSDAQILIGLGVPKGNPHGLVMFGTYLNGTDFAFTDANVVIRGCGKLAGGNHNYSVQAFGTGFAIKIENSPQPVLVGIGADGKLVGPASQVITGLQVTGETVTYNKNTGVIIGKTPIYGAITLNCAIGTLPPGPPQEIPNPGGVDTGIISGIFQIMQNMGNGNGATTPLAKAPTLSPGPRFIGVYTNGSDFRIQFQDASAVIDCKQSHIITSYDVSNKGGAATIAVKNGTTPFALTLPQNGTLAGPASVTVNGKLFTAMNGSNAVLTPTSASCSVASLAAATASK
jgi:hypothetical protein